MSIRPVTFNANGSIDVWHDEANHGGNVPAAGIHWLKLPNGNNDLRWMYLPCPSCDSESMHPASGGADPDQVQRLFARRIRTLAANRTWLQARAILRTLVQNQDGLARFKLANVNSEDE
jgi:hypothetical protein